MPCAIATAEPGLLKAQFFNLIRQPTLDQSLLEVTQEQLRALCPTVEHFYFEVVDAAASEDESRVWRQVLPPPLSRLGIM
jgi:hypothetical protein